MATINVHYDASRGSFPRIVETIVRHLTPAPERKQSIATKIELEKARKFMEKLQKKPNDLNVLEIPWNFAAHYAVDLGVVPDLTSKARDVLQDERYFIPVMRGCRRDYRLNVFSKEISSGDYPLTFRLDADSRRHADNLALTEGWKDVLGEKDRETMLDRIIDVGKKYGNYSPEHSAILANMPRTKDEFKEREEQLRDRLNATMFNFYVGMIRFYNDFFGEPIKKAGFEPIRVECIGPMNPGFDIPLKIVSNIAQHPQVPLEKILYNWKNLQEEK